MGRRGRVRRRATLRGRAAPDLVDAADAARSVGAPPRCSKTTAATRSGSVRLRRSACSHRRCARPAQTASWRQRTATRPAGHNCRSPAGYCAESAIEVDVLTYLGAYTRGRLERAVSASAHDRLARLAPGVDATNFKPGSGGDVVRQALGLDRSPGHRLRLAVGAAQGSGRLAARDAVDPARWYPTPRCSSSGSGPARKRLEAMTDRLGVRAAVRFTGSVPSADLPAYYDAGEVFAMPCRTRRAGLDVEGLGIVYLEASATGLPVVAGRSGGAPDAVLDGETGRRWSTARDVGAVAAAIVALLRDPRPREGDGCGRTRMGAARLDMGSRGATPHRHARGGLGQNAVAIAGVRAVRPVRSDAVGCASPRDNGCGDDRDDGADNPQRRLCRADMARQVDRLVVLPRRLVENAGRYPMHDRAERVQRNAGRC